MAVVSVENATSFSELLALRPARVLAIYTGGFASPAIIRLLRQIRAARLELLFVHWGELDAGGLRILRHLRRELGAVLPLAMDVATFEAYRDHTQPLTTGDRAAPASLRADAALADCHPLIDHLLRTGRKLEQEAVRVQALTNRLRAYVEERSYVHITDHRGTDPAA